MKKKKKKGEKKKNKTMEKRCKRDWACPARISVRETRSLFSPLRVLDNRSRSSFTFVHLLDSLSSDYPRWTIYSTARFREAVKDRMHEMRGKKLEEGKEESNHERTHESTRYRKHARTQKPPATVQIYVLMFFLRSRMLKEYGGYLSRFVTSSIASNQIYHLSYEICNFDKNIYRQPTKSQCPL